MSELLVVARYNEDVNWLRFSPIPHLVYNKGKDDLPSWINQTKIANIGREERAYLQFIVDHYYDLPDRIIFCQASPFEHSPNFLNLLALTALYESIQPLSYQYSDINPEVIYKDQTKSMWINNCKIHVDIYDNNLDRFLVSDRKFHDSSLITKLKSDFSNFFGNSNHVNNLRSILNIDYSCKINEISIWPVCYAAIFSVTKDKILRYQIEKYEELLDLGEDIFSNTNNPRSLFGWIMEFSWLSLFDYQPPKEIFKTTNFTKWWNCV